MRVSIVVTNDNHAEFVGDAVESALNQTHPDVEVIAVDDGSVDGQPWPWWRVQRRLRRGPRSAGHLPRRRRHAAAGTAAAPSADLTYVVPLLQRRGVFRTETAGRTLREHYGIPRPPRVTADAAWQASQAA